MYTGDTLLLYLPKLQWRAVILPLSKIPERAATIPITFQAGVWITKNL